MVLHRMRTDIARQINRLTRVDEGIMEAQGRVSYLTSELDLEELLKDCGVGTRKFWKKYKQVVKE